MNFEQAHVCRVCQLQLSQNRDGKLVGVDFYISVVMDLDARMICGQLCCCAPRCFNGKKFASENGICRCSPVLLLRETMIVFKQPRCCCHCTKMYQFTCSKVFAVKIGRNDHILFAFSAICINNILNGNTGIFRERSGTSSIVIFDSTELHVKNSPNGRHGLSGVNCSNIQSVCFGLHELTWWKILLIMS